MVDAGGNDSVLEQRDRNDDDSDPRLALKGKMTWLTKLIADRGRSLVSPKKIFGSALSVLVSFFGVGVKGGTMHSSFKIQSP